MNFSLRVSPEPRDMSSACAAAKSPLPRRALIACASIFAVGLLSACSALPDKPTRATVYDFGPAPLSSTEASSPRNPLPAITLPVIEAPGRLDGTQLLYRLGYANPQALPAYTQARWSQSPAALLRQRLRDGLAPQRAVLTPTEAAGIARAEGRAPDMLRISLDEFSQYFESPSQSVGWVRVNATLLRGSPGGDRVLAQRSFSAQRPAPTADAAGGVKALTAATDATVAQIVQWVDQQAR